MHTNVFFWLAVHFFLFERGFSLWVNCRPALQSEWHVTDVFGLQSDNWYGSTVNVSVSAEHPPTPSGACWQVRTDGETRSLSVGGAADLLPQVPSAGRLPRESLLLDWATAWLSGIDGGTWNQWCDGRREAGGDGCKRVPVESPGRAFNRSSLRECLWTVQKRHVL